MVCVPFICRIFLPVLSRTEYLKLRRVEIELSNIEKILMKKGKDKCKDKCQLLAKFKSRWIVSSAGESHCHNLYAYDTRASGRESARLHRALIYKLFNLLKIRERERERERERNESTFLSRAILLCACKCRMYVCSLSLSLSLRNKNCCRRCITGFLWKYNSCKWLTWIIHLKECNFFAPFFLLLLFSFSLSPFSRLLSKVDLSPKRKAIKLTNSPPKTLVVSLVKFKSQRLSSLSFSVSLLGSFYFTLFFLSFLPLNLFSTQETRFVIQSESWNFDEFLPFLSIVLSNDWP